MAQDMTTYKSSGSIFSADLAYLERHWQWVGEIVRTWASLADEERLDFAVEGPVAECRLEELQQQVGHTSLHAEQQARGKVLLARVHTERPMAERLVQTIMPPAWL